MRLSEQEFTAKITTPCACGGVVFEISSYVAMRQPLLDGEPFGKYSWAYKGEDFVRGVFTVRCHACKAVVFDDAACPRCDAPDGLERARAAENTFEIPPACATCQASQVSLLAYVPVRVQYKGERAEKARTTMRPEDPGFHGYRVECKACHANVERRSPCPLCAGAA